MVKPEELKVGQVVKVDFGDGYGFYASTGYLLVRNLNGGSTPSLSGFQVTKSGGVHHGIRRRLRTVFVHDVVAIISQPEEAQP